MGALLESTLEEAPSIEDSLWPKALEILRGIVTSFESQLKVVAGGGAEDPSVSARWEGEVAGLFPSKPAVVPSEPTLLAPDYLVPTLDAEVLSYFAPEADEYLQTMERCFSVCGRTPRMERPSMCSTVWPTRSRDLHTRSGTR